jgi:hypothetical protein
LDVGINSIRDLPEELSSLGNLKNLDASYNRFTTVPVRALIGMTALNTIDLSKQGPLTIYPEDGEKLVFEVPGPLLPILHPGLVLLDLLQDGRITWDDTSKFYLATAHDAHLGRNPHLLVKY